jgi:hypothetical protein
MEENKMKLKKILALAVSLAMVLSIVPAFSLTASAADDEVVLVDTTTFTISGEQTLSKVAGWTYSESGAAVRWNQNWGTTGVWGAGTGTYALMFFASNPRQTGDGNATASLTDTSASQNAGKISIDFKFACQTASDLYQRWNFNDADGNSFATFYFDKNVKATVGSNETSIASSGSDVLALRGTEFNITAEKNDEGTYTVTYSVAGEVVATEEVESVNGFGSISASVPMWNTQYAAAGLQELKITASDFPQTIKEVTATYTVAGETVATETKKYDTATATGVSFDAKNVLVDGVIYTAPETTLSDSAEIEMTVGDNYTSVAVGDTVKVNGSSYEVKSENLIPNGDFRYGMLGWTTRQGATPTGFTFESVEGISDTVASSSNVGGVSSANNLGTVWTVTPGTTYYLSLQLYGISSTSYTKVLEGTDPTANTSTLTDIAGLAVNSGWAKYDVVFEATSTGVYFTTGWMDAAKYANFELHEVELKEVGATSTAKFVTEDGTVVKEVSETLLPSETATVPAGEVFVLYNGYYSIPETVIASGENVEITVSPVANKYGVLVDALVSDNEIWGTTSANENSVFVSCSGDTTNRAPLTDANGDPMTDGTHSPSTLGKARVGLVEFPVVDVEDGQKVIANFYVRSWHGHTFSNSNTSIRLAATVLTDSSWTTLSDGQNYTVADAPVLESYPNAIFSSAHGNSVGWITFDVTDAVKAAYAAGLDTFDLKLNIAWGGTYIAESEKAVAGGLYENCAAYLSVEDVDAFEVTAAGSAKLIKNGSQVSGTATVTADDDLRIAGDSDTLFVATELGNYASGANLSFTEAADLGTTILKSFDIVLENGAQVRVGDGITEENKVGENGGLRFVATFDTTNSIADSATEYGVIITAEGSTQEVKVPAEEFQEEGVFTTALTNLKESNYNRNFTATPYAIVNVNGEDVTYTGASVTRSIYYVAAANLLSDEELGKTVKSVLNAYANQTGLRLTVSGGEFGVASTYTGDALFTVESARTDDGSYAVTVTPVNANVDLAAAEAWWTDYVRVNNNNSVAKTYISNASFDAETGALTFTFGAPSAE